MRDLTRFFEKFEKNKKGVGEMSGLDCKARHSRMMRVGRRVQNWEIDRALNEASRGALAPGLFVRALGHGVINANVAWFTSNDRPSVFAE